MKYAITYKEDGYMDPEYVYAEKEVIRKWQNRYAGTTASLNWMIEGTDKCVYVIVDGNHLEKY